MFYVHNLIKLTPLFFMVSASLYFYDLLPEQVPTKFNLSGNPIQFSEREFVVSFMPGLYLFTLFVVGLTERFMPKVEAADTQKGPISRIVFAIGVLFTCIHWPMLQPGANIESITYFISCGLGLFLVLCGREMSKVTPNPFIGIRTPWTMKDVEIWKKTHLRAQQTMVAGGVILLVISQFQASLLTAMAITLIATLSPVIHSYQLTKSNT